MFAKPLCHFQLTNFETNASSKYAQTVCSKCARGDIIDKLLFPIIFLAIILEPRISKPLFIQIFWPVPRCSDNRDWTVIILG